MQWRVVIERDDVSGEYAAWCPGLPGCASAGDTEEEALNNIREAIQLYLEPAPVDISSSAIIREVAV